ncbi:MAG: CtsR family transcriptional regulator [Firmicutes bacterium]|nr:CtsR family transcriptional regulator [Bacillota bacterium]
MNNLTDYIESYIKLLLERVDADPLEIQRRELAERFRCAPSQINYVLATRFSPERGYFVETRRGGGGYIRIFRVRARSRESLIEMVHRTVGEAIDRKAAEDLLIRLVDTGALDEQNANFIRAAIASHGYALEPDIERIVRARVLRTVLLFMLTQSREA